MIHISGNCAFAFDVPVTKVFFYTALTYINVHRHIYRIAYDTYEHQTFCFYIGMDTDTTTQIRSKKLIDANVNCCTISSYVVPNLLMHPSRATPQQVTRALEMGATRYYVRMKK